MEMLYDPPRMGRAPRLRRERAAPASATVSHSRSETQPQHRTPSRVAALETPETALAAVLLSSGAAVGIDVATSLPTR